VEGIRITPGDQRRFKASFSDTECQVCDRPISRGDPIGYLDYYKRQRRFGPLCLDCLAEQGVKFGVTSIRR